jgi:hypothetical protein
MSVARELLERHRSEAGATTGATTGAIVARPTDAARPIAPATAS